MWRERLSAASRAHQAQQARCRRRHEELDGTPRPARALSRAWQRPWVEAIIERPRADERPSPAFRL